MGLLALGYFSVQLSIILFCIVVIDFGFNSSVVKRITENINKAVKSIRLVKHISGIKFFACVISPSAKK